MGSLSSFLQLVIILFSSSPTSSSSSSPQSQPTQQIQSPRLLDLLIRDHTVNLSTSTHIKTGIPHTVSLPAKFTGAAVATVRLRCGSLRRYGAHIDEFRLPAGVSARPCVERILLIRQRLGPNWSQLYRDRYNLSRYRLISPILGILAYNAGDNLNQSNPFELRIRSPENVPIKIDFRKLVNSSDASGAEPYCATFESDGGKVAVRVVKMVEPFVCAAEKQGHFALVVILTSSPAPPRSPPRSDEAGTGEGEEMVRGGGGRASRWKVAVGSSIGAALGAFLLGLLLIAMFVRAKQRTKWEEMPRRRHCRFPWSVTSDSQWPTTTEHRYRDPYL